MILRLSTNHFQDRDVSEEIEVEEDDMVEGSSGLSHCELLMIEAA